MYSMLHATNGGQSWERFQVSAAHLEQNVIFNVKLIRRARRDFSSARRGTHRRMAYQRLTEE